MGKHCQPGLYPVSRSNRKMTFHYIDSRPLFSGFLSISKRIGAKLKTLFSFCVPFSSGWSERQSLLGDLRWTGALLRARNRGHEGLFPQICRRKHFTNQGVPFLPFVRRNVDLPVGLHGRCRARECGLAGGEGESGTRRHGAKKRPLPVRNQWGTLM